MYVIVISNIFKSLGIPLFYVLGTVQYLCGCHEKPLNCRLSLRVMHHCRNFVQPFVLWTETLSILIALECTAWQCMNIAYMSLVTADYIHVFTQIIDLCLVHV